MGDIISYLVQRLDFRGREQMLYDDACIIGNVKSPSGVGNRARRQHGMAAADHPFVVVAMNHSDEFEVHCLRNKIMRCCPFFFFLYRTVFCTSLLSTIGKYGYLGYDDNPIRACLWDWRTLAYFFPPQKSLQNLCASFPHFLLKVRQRTYYFPGLNQVLSYFL